VNMKRFWLILLGFALALSVAACQSKDGVLRISDAYMAFDEIGEYPTKVYAPADIFYCIVTVLDAPEEGASLKAIWYAVNAKGIAGNTVIDEIEITTEDAVVPFILSNEGPWPTGSYKVEIYLNGELDRTIRFKVK